MEYEPTFRINTEIHLRADSLNSKEKKYYAVLSGGLGIHDVPRFDNPNVEIVVPLSRNQYLSLLKKTGDSKKLVVNQALELIVQAIH